MASLNCSLCVHSTYANKVKLESTTNKPIQVFEVQVFSSGTNVALGKSSSQSDTMKKFHSSRAIDGKLDSFSHTKGDNAWLEIDLGGAYSIEKIGIRNRWCKTKSDPTDCLCRLSHVVVSLMDTTGEVVSSKTLDDTCDVEYLVLFF